MADELKAQKKKLRREIASILEKVSKEEVRRQSEKVEKKILDSKWYKDANVISIYVSTAGEIETDRLIRRAFDDGKTVFIPRFEKGNPKMQMIKMNSTEEFDILQPSLWGIRQFESAENRTFYQDFGAIDLVLMPGVAFSVDGNRCGHGMAFYDKFLTEHQQLFGKMPRKVALALREQIIDEVPTSSTDVKLDHIIEEK
ncbi:5-formyltetrahydrofolate cyclo-ligase [Aphelenchoides besseyi]|nr:5-formyltetrahydrofolate cyclo-ligase [Aphelenchoides besseyi]